MNKQRTLEIILLKVAELEALIAIHAKTRTGRDIMAHKLNGIRRTAENCDVD